MFKESFKKSYDVNHKMQWFINDYNSCKLVNLIGGTNKPMGSVIMPTGYGKSGFMFVDAIEHVKNTDGKIIIVFAAPILRLVAQTQNDFNYVLGTLCPELKRESSIKFFINSSANEADYDAESINSDVHYIDEFDKVFLRNKNAKVALIASCFNSLDKTAKQIKKFSKYATVCCYIDEAHKFISGDQRDTYAEGKRECDDYKYETLDIICNNANYCYAVTATEDSNVTEKINRIAYKRYGDDFYSNATAKIVNILGKQAIKENIIVPFNLYIGGVDEDSDFKILPKACVEFMDKLKKEDNNDVPQKILVGCEHTVHLKYLAEELRKMGKTVFATSCETGAFLSKNGETDKIFSKELQDEIERYEGDCFVLHIKQLTQGIDIKGITGCVKYFGSVINQGSANDAIQHIGRSLRTMTGERGVPENLRKKKYANVLIILPNNDMSYHIAGQLENLLIKYYGLEGIRFIGGGHEGRGSVIGSTKIIKSNFDNSIIDGADVYETEINEFKMNMKEYLETEAQKTISHLRQIGAKNIEEQLQKSLMNLIKHEHFNGDFKWSEILSDTELIDEVNDFVKKYCFNH